VAVPVHNHSMYSALDGLSTIDEMIERALEIGAPALGISDHGTVAGHIEFERKCREAGVKPILGIEAYHGVLQPPYGKKRDQAHLILGAMTDEGLRNLWRLSNDAAYFHHHVPRMTWEDFETKDATGVFATSACIGGLVAEGLWRGDYAPLNHYLEIFRDNFYIEIHTYTHDHPVGRGGDFWPDHKTWVTAMVDVARERGIPMIYADDAHFAFPWQYPVHDAYVALEMKDTIYTPLEERKMYHPNTLYIHEENEIRSALDYLPDDVVDECIQNSHDLAERIDAHTPEIRRHLPKFIPKDCEWLSEEDKKLNGEELFCKLVEDGIEQRYSGLDEAWKRALYEVEVMLKFDLYDYFLLAWDFIQYLKSEGVVTSTRGSASGAVLSYAMYLSDVDPIHYDLVFERFFNPGRVKGLPDIDFDVPTKTRDKAKNYLRRKWGKNNVQEIGNVAHLKPLEALNKTYKAFGIDFMELDAVKALVKETPDLEIHGHEEIGWSPDTDPGKKIYVTTAVGDKIDQWIAEQPKHRHEPLRDWLTTVDYVCSRVDGYGIHASGVVVSDCDLRYELPVGWSANKKTTMTQFPMATVEKRQFVKLDILGVRNLDTLVDWTAQMAKKGVVIEWAGLDLRENPPEMWELLHRGFARGIFQIEQGWVAHYCKEFKPMSVEDLSIIVAINRPGPKRAEVPDSFVARKFGREEVVYAHPMLEPITQVTYGHFVYQEQVMRFFNEIGYTLSETDAVRKILGKKKPVELEALKIGQKTVDNDWTGKGYFLMVKEKIYDERIADQIWKTIEGFASYSFNKGHSVSYGVLGFRTLYAKWRDTAAFTMALIRTNPDEAGLYVGEARRLGVKVGPPDVLKSEGDVAEIDGEVLFGLGNVSGVRKAGHYLVELREAGYDVSTPEALDASLEEAGKDWKARKKTAQENGEPFVEQSPRSRLKRNLIEALWNVGAWDNYCSREITERELQEHQKELLGIVLYDPSREVIANCLDECKEADPDCDFYPDLEEWQEKERRRLVGTITNVEKRKTKAESRPYLKATLELGDQAVEFVAWEDKMKANKFLWKELTPAMVTLQRTAKGVSFVEGTKLT
jgi:DNA polymerase-3 subunit alpha